MFRMYPTPAFNQPVIDLMAEMKRQHKLDPDDIAEVTVAMNWIETLYPSPAFPRFPDWNQPRVGGTHYFAAHAAVNGGYPVVGGNPFGPPGVKPEEDGKVLEFMNSRVRLIQEKDRAMFSPRIVVKMKNGATTLGGIPLRTNGLEFRPACRSIAGLPARLRARKIRVRCAGGDDARSGQTDIRGTHSPRDEGFARGDLKSYGKDT